MIIFTRLQQVKELITRLFVYSIKIGDPKAIQQIKFAGILVREGNANKIMFFITEEVKFKFYTRNCKSILILILFFALT